jgi:hypothetical protein
MKESAARLTKKCRNGKRVFKICKIEIKFNDYGCLPITKKTNYVCVSYDVTLK